MSVDGETHATASWEAPAATDTSAGSAAGAPDLLDEHPEVLAGAAFVGGLLTALIVRRLGR